MVPITRPDDSNEIFTLPTYYRENSPPPIEIAENFTTELFSHYSLENNSEVIVDNYLPSTFDACSNICTSKKASKKKSRNNTFQTRSSRSKKNIPKPKEKPNIVWRQGNFVTNSEYIKFIKSDSLSNEILNLISPIDFFRYFFDDKLVEHI